MKKFSFVLLVSGCLILFSGFYSQRSTETPKNAVELGKMLFFDPILSLDHSISCASCHKPDFAFADTISFSNGIKGKRTGRNTPSAMNVASRPYLFWDGRSPTLETQALQPISNPLEMGLPLDSAVARLKSSKIYTRAFEAVFHSEPTQLLLGQALAAFESSLETGDSPFDLFMAGDSSQISASAIRGRMIFVTRAGCFDCHFTPDFTGDDFKNIGLFNGRDLNDSGRIKITGNPEDLGKFKVPGLRNVALTAPYMHNGMFKTLEEVVAYYNNPDAFVSGSIGRDTLLSKPLNLTQTEKADLVAFLKSLTSPYKF